MEGGGEIGKSGAREGGLERGGVAQALLEERPDRLQAARDRRRALRQRRLRLLHLQSHARATAHTRTFVPSAPHTRTTRARGGKHYRVGRVVLSALLGGEGGRPGLEESGGPRRELDHHEAGLAQGRPVEPAGLGPSRLQLAQHVLRHAYGGATSRRVSTTCHVIMLRCRQTWPCVPSNWAGSACRRLIASCIVCSSTLFSVCVCVCVS